MEVLGMPGPVRPGGIAFATSKYKRSAYAARHRCWVREGSWHARGLVRPGGIAFGDERNTGDEPMLL